MPQPKFTGVCTFGGLALPNGQGTMTNVNLMDGVSWFLQAVGKTTPFNYDNRQVGLKQFAYRGRSAYVSDDFGPLKFPVSFTYYDGGAGVPLSQALASLMMAGEQRLSFDGATALVCKLEAVTYRKMRDGIVPPLWDFNLDFVAKAGFFQDITATTIAAFALNSGTATTFNVTYAGSVWCDNAVWTLTIPNTNAAPISSFVLANTTASQTLTINFPTPLAASTAWTLTIDTGASTVVDQNGKYYDFTGSFAFLFPPAGQVNAMSATLTPASGTATGCTLAATYTNRWLI